MNLSQHSLFLGLALAAMPAAAQTAFHITEFNEGLTSDIPGVSISGGSFGNGIESFQVDLPANYQISPDFFADIILGEPESTTTVNIVTPGQNNFLWLSEWPSSSLAPDQRTIPHPTELTFKNALLNVDANGAVTGVAGDLVVADRLSTRSVPDAGNTCVLLILSGICLAAVRRPLHTA